MKRNPNRTVTKACRWCDAQFTIPKCRDGREHFCTPACRLAAREAKSKADLAERTRTCATCGGQFVARGWQIRTGIGRYCSKACALPCLESGRTPETVVKRVASRKASRLAGLWAPKTGPDHPSWKGGPEAYRQRLKESGKLREHTRKYRAKNPEKVREFVRRRQGRKLGRLPRGTIKRIGFAQRWRCAACATGIRQAFHMDHIMPLALGGQHEPSNIQLLCGPCNVRKSAKHPVDFMQSRGYLL